MAKSQEFNLDGFIYVALVDANEEGEWAEGQFRAQAALQVIERRAMGPQAFNLLTQVSPIGQKHLRRAFGVSAETWQAWQCGKEKVPKVVWMLVALTVLEVGGVGGSVRDMLITHAGGPAEDLERQERP